MGYKPTPRVGEHQNELANLMDDGHILDSRAARKDIHTRAVENAIQESSDNPVLGAPTPEGQLRGAGTPEGHQNNTGSAEVGLLLVPQ